MEVVIYLKTEQIWSDYISEDFIQEVIKSAIDYLNLEKTLSDFSMSIILADNNFIAELNNKYANKDKATNVLSFANFQFKHAKPVEKLDIEEADLGDIILSFEKIKLEACEQNKSFQDHAVHLIIHGLLHILGFSHYEAKEASLMEGLEIQILKTLNISNPYCII